MKLNLIICIVIFLYGSCTYGNSESIRLRLLNSFGLDFKDKADPDIWLETELVEIEKFLNSLPRPLAQIGKRSFLPSLKITKSMFRKKQKESHSTWSLLNWQIDLDMHQGYSTYLSLRDGESSQESKEAYTNLINRQLIHHLLHVYDSEFELSDSSKWRSISGWKPREYFDVEIPFIPKESLNQDIRAFATAQGMESTAEDFATFGSLYFVTPDTQVERSIKCRTPRKFSYFKKLFPDHTSYLDQLSISCKKASEGFLDDVQFLNPFTRNEINMGPINGDTVEDFELLYATPGVNDAAEIAGHLVLRVKLKNNPMAEKMGIENPYDLVVSFLANTESGEVIHVAPNKQPIPNECESNIFGAAPKQERFDAFGSIFQALTGLSGGFLTTFDRQTLMQTVHHYTVEQDRNLIRYKLNLSKKQKQKLIERLYIAKKNYASKYYFFDRNCGSVLVQLIGEGIEEPAIEDFDPFVSPPNALLALLARKGLITQVFPTFYSYKRRGHVAQDIVERTLASLKKKDPSTNWPPYQWIQSKDDFQRAQFVERLKGIWSQSKSYDKEIYRLSTLVQESEMVYRDNEQRCENYTSITTEKARTLQADLLKTGSRSKIQPEFDTNHILDQNYQEIEREDALLGSNHTKLLAMAVSQGQNKYQNSSVHRTTLSGSIHHQEMGSISSKSMQRATAVEVGKLSVDVDEKLKTQGFEFSLLKVRKFKERVHEVPSFFSDEGTFGIGLKLLNIKQDRLQKYQRNTIGGGELLFNVASTRLNDRYIFLSMGLDLDTRWDQEDKNFGHDPFNKAHLVVPVGIEGLWSFDQQRKWQIRGATEWRLSQPGGQSLREVESTASLAYRAGEFRSMEWLVRIDYFNHHIWRDPWLTADSLPPSASGFRLGLEFNRW
jgi:hypothetical protein